MFLRNISYHHLGNVESKYSSEGAMGMVGIDSRNLALSRALTSSEIREIGEALYGSTWQGAMARSLGVPRQSVGYYLKSGVNGAQAAGIIGLIARAALRERRQALDQERSSAVRDQDLAQLLERFEEL